MCAGGVRAQHLSAADVAGVTAVAGDRVGVVSQSVVVVRDGYDARPGVAPHRDPPGVGQGVLDRGDDELDGVWPRGGIGEIAQGQGVFGGQVVTSQSGRERAHNKGPRATTGGWRTLRGAVAQRDESRPPVVRGRRNRRINRAMAQLCRAMPRTASHFGGSRHMPGHVNPPRRRPTERNRHRVKVECAHASTGRWAIVILVGTSGWQYQSWRGRFYPDGLPQRRWLERYAGAFATVEVNNAFYRLPDRSMFADWRDRTPDDFVVAVKMSRFLTHVRRLRDPAEPVARFLDRARALEGKFGPVLLQLPPTLVADRVALEGVLAEFPAGVRVAVEPRHRSWWTETSVGL